MMAKLIFLVAITPVFSVTWSLRNIANMLMLCSRNISDYYQTLCITNTQTYSTKSVLYKWNGTEILSPYHRWRTKKVREAQKIVWWDKAIFMNPLWFSSLHYECWRGHKSNISLTSVGHGMVNMPCPSISVLSIIGCSWKENNQDWSERGLQFFVI